MRKYVVVYERTRTGYSAYVPDLPGCVATGKTRKEIERRIYDAIHFHLEGLAEENMKIPPGRAESEVMVFDVK